IRAHIADHSHQIKAETHRKRAQVGPRSDSLGERPAVVRQFALLHRVGTTFASVGGFCVI
ncbi:hypothetical protein ABTL04_20790, partial [Acinetobacter baumannii]